MLNLGAIFTVILASSITSQHASPLQDKDLEHILNLLKGQHADMSKHKTETSASDSSLDEDSTNNSIYGLLKTMDVIDLINKANQEKRTSESQKTNKKRTHMRISNPVYRNSDEGSETQQMLEQLLQDKNSAHLKKEKHQRLTPKKLLEPFSLDVDDIQEQRDDGGLNEYSKIFVVLDPLAIQKSKNKNALTNLVSRILSLSSSNSEKANQEINSNQRYKGFRVKNHLLSRRYRRDSKESYGGGRDSLEEEFKPKRSRNDHAGGTGGRTAIPYIRQRGDIYEREH